MSRPGWSGWVGSRSVMMAVAALGCGWLLLSGGCDRGSNGSAGDVDQELYQRLVDAEQPAEVSSILHAYETYEPDSLITIAGRIYAEGMSPFDAGKAVFTIIELPKPGHNHEDPGDCPFCKRELKNAKFAIIKVVDESGQVLSRPADRLLGLSKNQDVVVSGKASLVGDTLVVRLQRLHPLTPVAAERCLGSFASLRRSPATRPVSGEARSW